MDSYTLFTYRNLEELRKIQEEREVFPFIFGETKDNLDYCSDTCIDISALVHFLLTNKNNIEPTYINFTDMTEDTIVIVEAALAESALELLPLLLPIMNVILKNMMRRILNLRRGLNLSHIPEKRFTNTITHRIWTKSFNIQKRMIFQLLLSLGQTGIYEKNLNNSIIHAS